MMDEEGRKAPTPVREAIRAMESFILKVNRMDLGIITTIVVKTERSKERNYE